MKSTTHQWLSLAGIIWLQSVSGTNTDYSAYSSQLKQLLSLSQLQLSILAFASDAGKLFAFVPGIAACYLSLWMLLLIGSILNLMGYGVQYLFLTGHVVSSLSYWQIFFLTFLAGNSISWINTVCNVVTARNFPSDHQVAVGLTTSYQVLSAKIYTVFFNSLRFYLPGKMAEIYLLLNSISPLIACLMAAPVVMDTGVTFGTSSSLTVGFIVLFIITIATGIYAVVSTLGSTLNGLSVSPLNNALIIVLFLLAPLAIPLVERIIELLVTKWSSNKEMGLQNTSSDHPTADHEIVPERMESGMKEGNDDDRRKVHDDDGVLMSMEEIGVKTMLFRVNFWLYFFVYLFGATLGLVYLNNLGQIAESRGFSGTLLLSLSSSFAFFGRVMTALMDYCLSRSRRLISRPIAIAAFMVPMAVAFFLLLNGADTFLFIGTAVIGVCTGAITSISVSLTLELFGEKNFAVNHNTLVSNIPIGSFAFGFLASLVYHKAEKQNIDHQNADGKCIGMHCYRSSFIVWGWLCVIGTIMSFILHVRTREFYSRKSKSQMESIST